MYHCSGPDSRLLPAENLGTGYRRKALSAWNAFKELGVSPASSSGSAVVIRTFECSKPVEAMFIFMLTSMNMLFLATVPSRPGFPTTPSLSMIISMPGSLFFFGSSCSASVEKCFTSMLSSSLVSIFLIFQ